MPKERKELGVGKTADDAINNCFPSFDFEKHEVVFDNATGLHSIFRRRVPYDRTVRKDQPWRETTTPYRHYRKPIVYRLLKGDMIELRLKKQKKGSYTLTLDDIFTYALRCAGMAAMREKRDKKKGKHAKN